MIIWLLYMGILLYWEIVYHIGSFGFSISPPWIMLGLLSILASLQTLITGWVGERHRKKIFWIFATAEYLVFAVQTVYYTIFKQPLQIKAMILGGEDALTNYWRETLMGILKASPILLILALPLIAAAVVFYYRKMGLPALEGIQRIRVVFGLGVSVLVYWMSLEFGEIADADYYHEYTEFYDPSLVMQECGVIPMVQRDIMHELELLSDEVFLALDRPHRDDLPQNGTDTPASDRGTEEDQNRGSQSGTDDIVGAETSDSQGSGKADGAGESAESGKEGETNSQGDSGESDPSGNPDRSEEPGQTDTPEIIYPEFHTIELDLAKLAELSAGNKEKEWLAKYIANLEPTRSNEYTGFFKDYNLIYITAEGFSTYAIHEELTPTLYMMSNSGFVFTDYYAPLWQTSTSDGEYVNLTGLIPDGQFSMRKTKNNNMAYSLPRYFTNEGCVNAAYHNHNMDYYERHLTHPNLGYDFKASKLGDLPEVEWGDKIFYMDNPGRWPSSDLEMIQYTVPEYIEAEQFNVYYMTVSGHMYYSFTGNGMSSKNKEAVAGLNMSENARAYIACHIELDKALEHLIQELANEGKLENTVIALSTDHYPYAMTEEQYEELAGRDLSNGKDIFRNTLILWNACMGEAVTITKPCCSVDILPTLLNLFGFAYDSRLYAGRDILSDAEGLVIFNDRSFVTDTVVYDRKTKSTMWRKEVPDGEKESYLNAVKQKVKDRYEFSAYILRQNYYDLVKQCEVE